MKVKEITRTEDLFEIIGNCEICHMGMVDMEGQPYVLPMNFGFDQDHIYIHCSQKGRKIDILKNNPWVSVAFSTNHELYAQSEKVACSYGMKYKSVILKGKAIFIDDYEEKVFGLNRVMLQYTGKTFSFSPPAVNNVEVIKIRIEEISGKEK